jgi:hypothetical protein
MRAHPPRHITSDRSFYYALPASIEGNYSPSSATLRPHSLGMRYGTTVPAL